MDDVWFEILVRVDPSTIFNCIMVCKVWLGGITEPEFRRIYQKRWKANSKVVGFTKPHFRFKLLATSKLGRIMNENKFVDDYVVFTSGAGDGLILYGGLKLKHVYVSKADEHRPIQLPLLDSRLRFTPAILSQNNSSFKVILAGDHNGRLMIQTFSSSSSDKWHESEFLTTEKSLDIKGPGISSSSRGMVYYPAGSYNVVAYDANKGCISGISPPYRSQIKYGMSSHGYLQCVIASFTVSGRKIEVWYLNDDDNNNKFWKRLHDVDPGDTLPQEVSIVSFVPGKSDCIFVENGGLMYLYNLNLNTVKSIAAFRGDQDDWVPVTMADLGVWPSSPFSDETGTNIGIIKHILMHENEIEPRVD